MINTLKEDIIIIKKIAQELKALGIKAIVNRQKDAIILSIDGTRLGTSPGIIIHFQNQHDKNLYNMTYKHPYVASIIAAPDIDCSAGDTQI